MEIFTRNSLINKKRRMRELRRASYRLRSLKRTRFASLIYQKKIGENLAIILFINHIIEFLECSFIPQQADESNENKRIAAQKLIMCLRNLREELLKASKQQKSISKSTIQRLGSTTKKLYRLTRKDSINFDCDGFWNDICLTSIPLFMK